MMSIEQLKANIINCIDEYIIKWQMDGTTDALENRIVAMTIAKKIIERECQTAIGLIGRSDNNSEKEIYRV